MYVCNVSRLIQAFFPSNFISPHLGESHHVISVTPLVCSESTVFSCHVTLLIVPICQSDQLPTFTHTDSSKVIYSYYFCYFMNGGTERA